MFTTHSHQPVGRRPINARIAAAVLAAGLIGTAGLAAAAAGGGDEPPTAQSVTDTTVADAEPTDTTNGGTDTSPDSTTTPDDTEPTAGTTAESAADGTGTPPAVATESGDEPGPTPDDPESDPSETPGEITGPETVDPPPPPPPPPGRTEFLAPVDKPDPPAPVVPGPTDLLPGLTDPDPDPTPFDGPTDFQVAPLPGWVGTITSGLTGCQLDCVTSAQLIANGFDASVMLQVETTVPVHVEVEVTETGTDSSAFFNGPGYDDEWALHLSPLQPDTTYDLTLIVIDADGHSKVFEHQFTTVDVIDGLVGNAQGCALHCITEGSVDTTDTYSTVSLHVGTDSPAVVEVWVSTSAPGWVGGTPFLPADAKVHDTVNTVTSTTFDVAGLEPDTTYHVIARAEDDWGVDHRVGTFHTDPAPPVAVTVTFERIEVLYDGDHGALNRGELSFAWGFDGGLLGHRSEEKMHAGTVITPGSHQSATYLLPAVGWELPNPTVGGSERDADGLIEYCTGGLGSGTAPSYNADCDSKSNVAQWGGPVTREQVAALPSCAAFGLDADLKCAVIGTPNEGDDYARFNVLLSFAAP